MTRKVTEGLEERRSRLGGAGLFFVCFVVVCLFVLIFRWIYIYISAYVCERYRSSENKYVHGYIDNYKCMFVSATANKYIQFSPLKHAVAGFL